MACHAHEGLVQAGQKIPVELAQVLAGPVGPVAGELLALARTVLSTLALGILAQGLQAPAQGLHPGKEILAKDHARRGQTALPRLQGRPLP